MNKPLVTVVLPLYNSETYIDETIQSVKKQTMPDWNLIIVDDCSTDGSFEIARSYSCDERIRVFRQERNKGVAEARNSALALANSRFVAYLDSDDVWLPKKLEHQIAFMESCGAKMCFTSYETITSCGAHRNFVHVPYKLDYPGFLKNTITCSHTMIIDCDSVDPSLLMVDNKVDYDFPEDLAAWLQVLKTGIVAFGLDEVLAKNRKHSSSRSSNKLAAINRTWNQYRKREQLGTLHAAYCLFFQLYHAALKRL